jgi:hypothetical protein
MKFSKPVKAGDTWTVKCPKCGKVGVLDEDQFFGRISTECPREGCGFHEMVDWSKIKDD